MRHADTLHETKETDSVPAWLAPNKSVQKYRSAAISKQRPDYGYQAQFLGVTMQPSAVLEPAARAVALVKSGIFDSYMIYERAGVWTVAGGTQAAITLDANGIELHHRGRIQEFDSGSQPLGRIGDVLANLSIPAWSAYGWVSFEVAHLIAGQPELAPKGTLAHLIVPETEVRFELGAANVACVDDDKHAYIRTLLDQGLPADIQRNVGVDIGLDGDSYQRNVESALHEINAARLSKVILSRSVPVNSDIDLHRTYLHGRAANNPARSFLLDLGGRRAAGFCPETILEVSRERRVATQLLAGTRSCGAGDQTDRHLLSELVLDQKEVYEHAITVKAACDEFSRLCAAESVSVDSFMSVERRGSVQHLASNLSGELSATTTPWDALEAVFPAITVTGIPKQQAIEFIARTEQTPRGLYSGAVIAASHDGSLDAGLILRAIYKESGQSWLRAGAGIVSASRPQREYEETCEKLRSVAPYLIAAADQRLTLQDYPS